MSNANVVILNKDDLEIESYYVFDKKDTFLHYAFSVSSGTYAVNYYSNEEFDFEDKIFLCKGNYCIVKNKYAILLKLYIKICDPEEAMMLKLKYL